MLVSCNMTGLFREVEINEPFMEVSMGPMRYRDLKSDLPSCILYVTSIMKWSVMKYSHEMERHEILT